MVIIPRGYNPKLDRLAKWYNHPWITMPIGVILGAILGIIGTLAVQYYCVIK